MNCAHYVGFFFSYNLHIMHITRVVTIRTLTIRYVSRYLSHDTIRIAILGENRKMNQVITIGSLYCILCSFDLSRQHLAFALLLFNSMNTLYIIV